MATTDFSTWLDSTDPEGAEEIYSLYNAVSDKESNGFYKITKSQDQIFVKAEHVEETLIIASPAAKKLFLELYSERYMDGDTDAESWFGFHRNMENPNA